MSNVQLEEKVRDIIINSLKVSPEEITPEATFMGDLRADSLDTQELMMAFETEFNIEIPDADSEKLQTVGSATDYLKKRLAENA